jgi:REP element-mobilizing transposase RayT
MENYFGKIEKGIIILNDYGKIAENLWIGLPKVFKNIILDIFVIMPNHMHAIIAITHEYKQKIVGNATLRFSKSSENVFSNQDIVRGKVNPELHSLQDNNGYKRTKMQLSKIIQTYKAETTRRIKRISKFEINHSVWQKSFYDRIIRTEKEFNNIQQYIFEPNKMGIRY